MTSTTDYLEEQTVERLRQVKERYRVPVAVLIREAVEKLLVEREARASG